ncbi:MAG: hypothetical protein MUF10_20765 [Thermoanaerobaculaceae bacterium]|nr:hypothetical protein [Thermoanaerobaculaceae bacterium]
MWQLRGREMPATHRPDEVRPSAEDAALLAALDLQHANSPTQLLTDHPHRFKQIGIVGDHNSHIERPAEGIEHEMRRQVDVRSLLLRNPDLVSARSADRRADEPLPLGVLDELAEVDGEARQRRQRFKIRILPGTLPSASARRVEASSEEAHEFDVIARQRLLTEAHEVEPLVIREGTPPEGGVVEVEAVDVDPRPRAR